LLDEDRELTKRYDEIVNSLLNGLVKKGILSQEDVENAAPEQIEEFLDRLLGFVGSSKGIDFYEFKKRDTIRSIFASSQLKQENANCSIGRPEVLNIVKDVFEQIKEKRPEVKGFLVFGSSIDPKKIARFNDKFKFKSDIDILPIVQPAGGFDLMAFDKALREITEISFLVKQIKASFMLIENLFLEKILSNRPWEGGMPFWANEPKAVYYIGSLFDEKNNKNYTEQEVNELLQKQLHSTAYKTAKLVMLENIREKILQGQL